MASLIDLFKVANYLTLVNFARSNLDSQVEHKFYLGMIERTISFSIHGLSVVGKSVLLSTKSSFSEHPQHMDTY